jgi:ABC-type Fe3+ transport system permease subunit
VRLTLRCGCGDRWLSLCWLCWLIVANGSQRTHPGAGAQGKDAGARLDRLGVVGVVDLLAWCAWLLVAVVVVVAVVVGGCSDGDSCW